MAVQPKKPLTAFFMYLRENRERLRGENSELSHPDFMKFLGTIWKDLPDKKGYEALAKEAKRQYDLELSEFIKQGGDPKVRTKLVKSLHSLTMVLDTGK
jgi:high mobility group protein B2